MSLNFEKYASKGNEFVHLVAEDLEVSRNKAGRIIRAVLHALRNRLSHEDSFHLLAQLPMVFKGVYVDGWKFDKIYKHITHLSDFLDEIRQEDGGLAQYDFGNDIKAKQAVTAVFKGLNFLISEGEMNNIIAVMPAQLKKYIKEVIAGEGTIF
jgi:uncharacterized protein (DUF2267 family)